MDDLFIEVNGKKLRCGYTTGSTATAAAKAATYMLLHGVQINKIEINTPKGIKLNLNINSVKITDDYVIASVIKDGGDDIDATNGIEIFAKVETIPNGFELTGGIGIGLVTKKGLSIAVGEYAINPVPREMIEKEVCSLLKCRNVGVKVTIFAPEGIEIAKKTFNPRLGIDGGISILGTTGIVYPMSIEALKETIKVEVKQKASLNKRLVLTFGNMGEKVAKQYGFNEDQIVIISNFVGYALECCQGEKVEEIILVGHIGKISKVAYGCFDTHSRVNDVRLEVLALELALLGYETELVQKVMEQKTSQGAVELLGDGFDHLYENIGQKIVQRLNLYTHHSVKSGAIMYSGYVDSKVIYSSIENK